MMNEKCPFCNPVESRVWHCNELGVVLWDGYPVSEGHSLVIPRSHVVSFFDLSEQEQLAMWELVGEVRQKLTDELSPDGFNVGLNDGTASGQTVMHAHIHVIPRRNGDVADPRGGVRWVVPDKACYWSDE